jgi:protein-tyrosine-phosphatase
MRNPIGKVSSAGFLPRTGEKIKNFFKPNLKRGKMKIIFICKYNAFRSRIAEEYFKKINRNPRIETISRGFIYGGKADFEQFKLAKQMLGVDIYKRSSMQIKLDDLKNADKIIVVANDVPKVMFNYKGGEIYNKIAFWKIKDEQKGNKKNIKRIILEIKNRIDKLNKKLEKIK